MESFDWLQYCAPCFEVNGDNIEILYTPNEFYEKLLTGSKTAKKRVVLAALYLGNGEYEQKLVDSLLENLKSKVNSELKIDIMLDFVRGSRGVSNSRTMLLPLLKQDNNNVNVALYHTPMLRGYFKKYLPNRWNETIGVAHLKVFIFDNTLLLSGANLSNDYFKNRQDRYMIFHDCEQLANYFNDLVKTVSLFSFQLKPDDTVYLNKEWDEHPYEGNLNSFIEAAHCEIKDLITSNMLEKKSESVMNKCWNLTKHPEGFLNNFFHNSKKVYSYFTNFFTTESMERNKSQKFMDSTELNTFSNPDSKNDTWIYPTLQMGPFGICQDQFITETLMRTFPPESMIYFTSGYFNVTDDYCNLLLHTSPNYKILLASPEANGFLGAKGFAGYIPAVYIYLARKFYNQAQSLGCLDKISLLEYVRQGWTFHGKGLWCYMPNENLPSATLIGSPNFGSRSVTRDLEAQAVVFTKNKKLQQSLDLEKENLTKYSVKITQETFNQDRYRVPRWVIFVTQLIKRYF